MLGSEPYSRLRTVTTNHDHGVDLVLPQRSQRDHAHLVVRELGTGRAAQHCAAPLQDAAHLTRPERFVGCRQQPAETIAHSQHGAALGDRAPNDGAYGRVHTGGVTTRGQNRDTIHVPTPGASRVADRLREAWRLVDPCRLRLPQERWGSSSERVDDWEGMTDLHGLVELLREEFAALLRLALSGESAA
jgi:hypothetical protein